MTTIGGALAAVGGRIDAREARVLLAHVLEKDATYLTAYSDAPLGPAQKRAFDCALSRRAQGEPVAYITGRREFHSLEFQVTPAVLIPRPETELLVDLALERIAMGEARRVLDLGTGSGCVAISIAYERPHARVLGVDASLQALSVARQNANRLGVSGVEFIAGDWFEPIGAQLFDVIVANPPYVAEGDAHLVQGDLRYEPRDALVAGRDGLAAIRRIVVDGARCLHRGGTLLLEHGYDQGPACRALLRASGLQAVETWRDLAGLERVSGGRSA